MKEQSGGVNIGGMELVRVNVSYYYLFVVIIIHGQSAQVWLYT